MATDFLSIRIIVKKKSMFDLFLHGTRKIEKNMKRQVLCSDRSLHLKRNLTQTHNANEGQHKSQLNLALPYREIFFLKSGLSFNFTLFLYLSLLAPDRYPSCD